MKTTVYPFSFEELRDTVDARHPNEVSIDFETYSDIDLRKVGAYNYAHHESTEILLLSWSTDYGETVHRWEYGDPPPLALFKVIRGAKGIRAFNAAFEELIWGAVCVKKMGWPDVPHGLWVDTMTLALSVALPGSLEACAKALDLPIEKQTAGKALMRFFSQPRKPTKKDASRRNLPSSFPEKFIAFGTYCDFDVMVESAIYLVLPFQRLRGFEKKVHALNRKLNERGVALDVKAFTGMQSMIARYRSDLTAELREITSGEVQTDGQRAIVMDWCKRQGFRLKGYTAFDIEHALKKDMPDKVRRVLTIRQELSQVSTKKYEKMALVVNADGRVRNNLIYHRASTGRNGGVGLQLHNFPRDYLAKEDHVIEEAIDLIGRDKYEEVMLIYGNPLDVAKGLLRPMIIASPGQIFYVSDFSGVENRGTAWISCDNTALQVFIDNRDQYIEFAASQFRLAPEDVSAEQRTAAKATILGGMFGSGWKKIYDTNVLRGIPMTEDEARRNIEDLRSIYHVTAATWYELERAAKKAVRTLNDVPYKGLLFGVRKGFLFIRLPSGRLLSYYEPVVEKVMTPWGKERMGVTYSGLTAQKKWLRLNLTPSRLIENIVSGICRDLLMYSEYLIEQDKRVVPILDVHDEIISEGDPDAMTLDEYTGFMETIPDWAYNHEGVAFPLKAEGYKSTRYRK